MEIKIIYFDWYGKNEDNPESFGQITLMNEYDEKMGVINLDLEYEDVFLLIYSIIAERGDKSINCIYEKVI